MPDTDDQDVACRCNPVAQHVGARTEDGKPLAHVVAGGFADVRLFDRMVCCFQDHAGRGLPAVLAGQSHSIPRGARAESPLACGGDAGRKGQGEEWNCSAREVRDRAACGDDVGQAAQACLRDRCGELRALRQSRTCRRSCASMRPRRWCVLARHREHRGAGADRADPGACESEGGGKHGLTRPTVDRAAGECVSGAREGGRIGSREAAIRDRQGAVLRAGDVRRDPGERSGCEGRCTFPE